MGENRNPEFTTHILNDDGLAKSRAIRDVFDDALNRLLDLVPAGRELAIVKTKLEEASFFAKKGMANKVENQQRA